MGDSLGKPFQKLVKDHFGWLSIAEIIDYVILHVLMF